MYENFWTIERATCPGRLERWLLRLLRGRGMTDRMPNEDLDARRLTINEDKMQARAENAAAAAGGN